MQIREDQQRSQPTQSAPAPARTEQARTARAAEGRDATPQTVKPKPAGDGWNGSTAGDHDIMAFRSLARQFRPTSSPPRPVTPQYPPRPSLPGQWDPAGPTPGLAENLRDVRDPQGRPLDGRGVTIGVIDLYNERTGEVNQHADGVESTAHAVAPGAHTHLYSPVEGGNVLTDLRPDGSDPSTPQLPANLPDTAAALDQALLGASPDFFVAVTRRLNQLADDPNRDPNMRVINMSLGGSRSDYYDVVQQHLNQRNDDGSWRYPEQRLAVLGENPLKPLEEARRIAHYTDPLLDDVNSAYSRAQADYRNTTARLAAPPYNIQLVVAAGNKGARPGSPRDPLHQQRADWEEVHPGSNVSDMTRSPDVIAVANYDVRTHQLDPMSGEGDGRENRPGQPTMVAAPGNGTIYPDRPSTSAATPHVAGTIALMLQANPGLTPAQIREILRLSSQRLPGVDPSAQGAGLLDAEAAVRAARDRRQTP